MRPTPHPDSCLYKTTDVCLKIADVCYKIAITIFVIMLPLILIFIFFSLCWSIVQPRQGTYDLTDVNLNLFKLTHANNSYSLD